MLRSYLVCCLLQYPMIPWIDSLYTFIVWSRDSTLTVLNHYSFSDSPSPSCIHSLESPELYVQPLWPPPITLASLWPLCKSHQHPTMSSIPKTNLIESITMSSTSIENDRVSTKQVESSPSQLKKPLWVPLIRRYCIVIESKLPQLSD